MSDVVKIHKYAHGGARIFINKENGGRDLIADLYGDADRSEKIILALVAACVIPHLDKCEIFNVG